MHRNLFKKPAIIISLAVFVVAVTATIVWAITTSPITITDTFHDLTKINTAANVNVTVDTTNGQVSLSAASTWTCGSSLLDSRDGQSYTTVLIGSQCWMSQNLNIGDQITSCTGQSIGVSITTACTPLQNQGTSTIMTVSTSTSVQKYCYANMPGNCSSQGGLYQWTQAMGGGTTAGATGICMAGWHLPTDAEYKTLEIYLGMCSGTGSSPNYCADDSGQYRGTTQGTQLKSGGTSGFNGVLAGARNTDGSFIFQNSNALFWSSLVSGGSVWGRYLGSGYAGVYRNTFSQTYGFSVRCVHN